MIQSNCSLLLLVLHMKLCMWKWFLTCRLPLTESHNGSWHSGGLNKAWKCSGEQSKVTASKPTRYGECIVKNIHLQLDSSFVMWWGAAGLCWELKALHVGLQFLLLSSWIDFINTIFPLIESVRMAAGFHGFLNDHESSHLDTLRKQSQLLWGRS